MKELSHGKDTSLRDDGEIGEGRFLLTGNCVISEGEGDEMDMAAKQTQPSIGRADDHVSVPIIFKAIANQVSSLSKGVPKPHKSTPKNVVHIERGTALGTSSGTNKKKMMGTNTFVESIRSNMFSSILRNSMELVNTNIADPGRQQPATAMPDFRFPAAARVPARTNSRETDHMNLGASRNLGGGAPIRSHWTELFSNKIEPTRAALNYVPPTVLEGRFMAELNTSDFVNEI